MVRFFESAGLGSAAVVDQNVDPVKFFQGRLEKRFSILVARHVTRALEDLHLKSLFDFSRGSSERLGVTGADGEAATLLRERASAGATQPSACRQNERHFSANSKVHNVPAAGRVDAVRKVFQTAWLVLENRAGNVSFNLRPVSLRHGGRRAQNPAARWLDRL